MDFPRAWEIARETYWWQHHPQCSFRKTEGGMLCDCPILTRHPEYEHDYGIKKETPVDDA